MSGRRWLIPSTLLLTTTVVCIFFRKRRRGTSSCGEDDPKVCTTRDQDGSKSELSDDLFSFRQQLVAELRDKNLFNQQPPPTKDCPICMLPLPILKSASMYLECCGKSICCGCYYAHMKMKKTRTTCPFFLEIQDIL